MTAATRLSGRRLPILMYHSISDTRPDPNQICVSRQRFAEQLAWLRSHRLRGVSMRELLEADAAGQGGRLVGMTFDDGYEDFLTNTCPSWSTPDSRRRCSSSPSGSVRRTSGTTRPGCGCSMPTGLRAVAQLGMEIGSHSCTHARLLSVDDEQRRRELVESRGRVGSNHRCRHARLRVPLRRRRRVDHARRRTPVTATRARPSPGIVPTRGCFRADSSARRDGGMRLRVKLALAGR